MAFVDDKIGKVGSILEMAAGMAVTERGYMTEQERQLRARIRNMSTEELLSLLDKCDPRFAQVVRAKVGRGGWSYHRGKLMGMKEIPELGQLKLILQRLSTMENGGSLLESLRVMTLIAILQQIIRNIQGLVG
jgi:hypothetical protein